VKTGTAERGHQTPRAGRYVEGIGGQLRPQHYHHAPRDARRMTLVVARNEKGRIAIAGDA
jgi:hypothetical protein